MHGLYSEANERQADVYQTKEACVGVKFNITEKIILITNNLHYNLGKILRSSDLQHSHI